MRQGRCQIKYSILCFLGCVCLVCGFFFTGCGKNTAGKVPANCDAGHLDQNDDGLCDRCSESVLVNLDFYAVNDLHGRFADTDYQPGVDELTTFLKQAKEGENAIVLSTGDMWQGTTESYLTKGFLMTEWMNQVGFAAMTIGGHEFDWGEDGIRENRELASFPFLGINIYSRETDQQVDYCQSSVTLEVDGAQIGIIGAIGNCYHSIASENVKDVYFKNGSELTDLVKAESQKLRSQGADFIVYTIHDGTDITTDAEPVSVEDGTLEKYYDTALSKGYVDLVFEADTHYWYALQDTQGVYHLQAGGNNKGLSHAQVLVNKANGKSQVLTAELLGNSAYIHGEKDPVVAQLLDQYEDQIAPAAEIIGSNGQYRNGRGVCQLVANLYCDAGLEKWGEEYDIVLGGGYISCRSPGYMPEGQVSYSQLFSLLPFDNKITLCSISGRDLVSKFLETDQKAYFIKTTQYGEGIRGSIDPDATYYVVTDTYSAYYAANNMTVIDTYDEKVFARDLLAELIAAGGLL